MELENKGVTEVRALEGLDFAMAQSQGTRRGQNEDAMLALSWHFLDGTGQHDLGLFAVADGVGGEPNGQVASRSAVRGLGQSVAQDLLASGEKMPFRASLSLKKGFSAAQRAVMDQAHGGGTTLTVALIEDSILYLGHVGDSRAYTVCHNRGLLQLSEDHSLGRWMRTGQDEGRKTRNPLRNVLTQAVGQAQGIKPQFLQADWSAVSGLLLCTDGVWKSVTEQEVENVMRAENDLAAICRRLVTLGNERGGSDNMSVMLIIKRP